MDSIKKNNLLKKIRNLTSYSYIAFALFLFISCSEDAALNPLPGIDFGTSEYHESFLFTDSKNQPVSKSIKTDFNSWAKTNKADATLILVDDKGNLIGKKGSEIELYINGVPSDDGRIYLGSLQNSADTLKVELRFSPTKNSRNFSGFVQLESGNVERINNISTMGPNPKLFQWNARQEVILNPLLKGLYWATALLTLLLLLWFLLLRNQVYPKMGNGRLTVETPYYKSFKTKGKRNINLTSKGTKQSNLNVFFAGKRVYEVNPVWEDDLIFSPGRRKNQLRIKLPMGSTIEPYTSKITRGQSYIITKDNLKIKVSYL